MRERVVVLDGFATLDECRQKIENADANIFGGSVQQLRKFIEDQPDQGVVKRVQFRLRCGAKPLASDSEID